MKTKNIGGSVQGVEAKRYREKLGIRVSAGTWQQMVSTVGRRCKSPSEMSQELGWMHGEDIWWQTTSTLR